MLNPYGKNSHTLLDDSSVCIVIVLFIHRGQHNLQIPQQHSIVVINQWLKNVFHKNTKYSNMYVELKRAIQLSETMKSAFVWCIKHISRKVCPFDSYQMCVIFPWLNLNNAVQYFLRLTLSNFPNNDCRRKIINMCIFMKFIDSGLSFHLITDIRFHWY